MRYVLQPFGYKEANFGYNYNTSTSNDFVRNNIAKLDANFHKQVNAYKRRYPRYPKRVRFTQEEIDVYF